MCVCVCVTTCRCFSVTVTPVFSLSVLNINYKGDAVQDIKFHHIYPPKSKTRVDRSTYCSYETPEATTDVWTKHGIIRYLR